MVQRGHAGMVSGGAVPPPRISDYLRITIGTPAQMQRFFAALDEILGLSLIHI